ncbi:hypothetical protein VTJ04DRAFT_5100 [Mycothermus thermophilus]|uniref:uncharacterized protein n=1 Tax=Humicola insolens TaxID=85995 RepID=UPI003741E985
MPPLRLAILEADIPVPQTHQKYHGYLGVFAHLLQQALPPSQPLSSILTLTGHDVVTAGAARPDSPPYPLLDSIDAILISGSKHNAFDNEPWIVNLVSFVQKALEKGIKVVGICFGHQILARALSTPVGRADAGWEVSVTPTQLTPAGQKIFGTDRQTLYLQQMHRDQVFGVPDGAELLASSDKCPNHGFWIPGKVLTVQGHPEFTAEIMREILDLRKEAGIFPEGVYESGVERNGDHHDGVLVAKAILRFLQEDSPADN